MCCEQEKLLLRKENELLKNKLQDLQNNFQNLQNELKNNQELIDWFKKQLFGKKSEKYILEKDDKQLYFEGFEDFFKTEDEEKVQKISSHKRKIPQRNGQDKIVLPDDLPIETIILDVSEEKKICKITKEPLKKIGEEVTHKLAYKPGSYFIKKYVRPKYALPNNDGIVTSNLPDSIIGKSKIDESFLAKIITDKFANHLPLYRISEILSRENIIINRKLLSNWIVKAGKNLKLLKDEMLKQILESKNIFVDETPITFLDEKSKQGYAWTICGGKSADPPYRIYFFSENRKHKNILEVLENYNGILHSDKYGAYVTLAEKKQITWCPCMVHIRRKFLESSTGDKNFKEWVLEKIGKLFQIEKTVWDITSEERKQKRIKEAMPIMDELIKKIKEKVINGKILPKSKYKEALHYFYSLVPYLKNYIHNPYARLDNNVAERAIRPLAIGRKNWLFFGSTAGADAGTTLLSLVQTCRGLNINPFEYLQDIMKKLMSHSNKKLYQLLPDRWLLSKK